MPRYKLQKDQNQREIVKTLKQMGASVLELPGSPDLIVGFRNRNYLFEVKFDKWSPFTPAQVKLFATWRGQLTRIECLDDALSIIRKDGAIET